MLRALRVASLVSHNPVMLVTLVILAILLVAFRIVFLLPPLRPRPRPRRRPGGPYERRHGQRPETTRLVVVLGSGGHTAEMLAMLRKLDATAVVRSWSHRTYVVSDGDGFSAARAREFEEDMLARIEAALRGQREGGMNDDDDDDDDQATTHAGTYTIHTVPRARAVHQSLLTTPVSAMRCLQACVWLLAQRPPDLILANGPGTSAIVVLAALLLRFADVGDTHRTSRVRAVYVESWARVTRLSLTGRLLLPLVDRFVVQWEQLLVRTGRRGEFLGVLV